MPREARQIVLRNVIAEVVEEEERVELGCIAEAERAAQVHARAFEGRLGFDQPLEQVEATCCPPVPKVYRVRRGPAKDERRITSS